MSPRARRIAFGLIVVLIGSLMLAPILFVDRVDKGLIGLGVLAEIAVVVVGVAIALTKPPVPSDAVRVEPEPHALGPASPYRGASPPAIAPAITKASAKRLTIGILAALVVTAAAVPFAVHLPRWIEVELVVGAWWAIWSTVLAVIAYRGAKLEDDHRPSSAPVVDFGGVSKPKGSWALDGIADLEACAIALVVVVALAGAWLVVELIAPAVFIVAYRGVRRALAKAHAAKTHGDALRSAYYGMGWAALGTAPLAGIVVLVHALFSA